ncbi:MAG: chromosomal replication initiator protein DnaA [Clostridia bacterium]|nr:chromosomal replication initiator protein DnaA [Clostridia bacterium]
MESVNELWALVQAEIKTGITEVIYEVWMSNLKLESFDGINAVISTDNFRLKIIEQKFLKNIKEAFEKVTGFEVNIIFEESNTQAPVKKPEKKVESAFPNTENNTFETFVVGSSNRFAHAAALAVAAKPGAAYNPLFIYGHSGLGKTHLMCAISNEIQKNDPDANVVYTRCENFVSSIVEGIQTHRMTDIHEKYRNADVLLVDDVQFLGGKESTQEEFFNTFDTLASAGKQIVLTSDRPPREINVLNERLRTRFEWGLIADIKPPDVETRMAIINRKAEAMGLELPADVVAYIAENIKSNVRQLEGAVKKMEAFVTIHGAAVNIATAQSAIKDILNNSAPAAVTVDKIINEVARTYGGDPAEIRSEKRNAKISRQRKLAMYIVREMTNLSSEEIGEKFGGRDHSTVLYAIKETKKEIDANSSLKATVDDIIKNVGES